jgi:2-phospho-L-lactate guanylyltransferase
MVEVSPATSAMAQVAVLVPVKAFTSAKLRLAEVLDPAEREGLAREMAATVLRAARSVPVAVVCDDDAVRTWAAEQGARVIWTPGLGLNGAVDAGVAELAAAGVSRIVVAHADLPLATDLTWVAAFGGVTLVPDRHGDGTNVACVPAGSGFRFAYGAGSFTRHRAEAARVGLPVRLVPDRALGWDVDLPRDLHLPDGSQLVPEALRHGRWTDPSASAEAPCP